MIVFSDMDGTPLTSDKQMSDFGQCSTSSRAAVLSLRPARGARCRASLSPFSPTPPYTTGANGASVWAAQRRYAHRCLTLRAF